jgi:hypothetical protein
VRELRITDGELQTLIATALRRKLAKAGFKTGTPSDANAAFFFPINLELTGDCEVIRHEDGTWTFTQEETPMIADRIAQTAIFHAAAIAQREATR